jgi:hypothetical protein
MKTVLEGALFGLPLLVVFFVSLQVVAQEDPQAPPPTLDEQRTWEQSFIEGNIAISKWFDSVAEGLDLFLVGKKVTKIPNQSNLRFENSTASTEGHSVTNTTGVSVNPRLPNLEEYWHLKFATYDEREDRRNAKNAYLRQNPRAKNYGATVGVFKKLGNIRTAFQPRIELQDPLRVSHSLTFESVADLKTYEVNPKLEFYATPDKGVGTFQALNFNFLLSKIFSLTLINQGDYEEKTHLFSVVNGISIGQVLTPTSAFAYNTFFSSNNHPNYHLESYNFSVAYSQVLYKRILDYQVVPNLDFQKTISFKGVAGLTININLNF